MIQPGRNYGWPIASDSREYSGLRVSDTPWLAEFERPEVLWWPSIAPSGLTFYNGDQFPAWQGNLFGWLDDRWPDTAVPVILSESRSTDGAKRFGASRCSPS